jgi:hypothetical protein
MMLAGEQALPNKRFHPSACLTLQRPEPHVRQGARPSSEAPPSPQVASALSAPPQPAPTAMPSAAPAPDHLSDLDERIRLLVRDKVVRRLGRHLSAPAPHD